jgi:hypothetical protein
MRSCSRSVAEEDDATRAGFAALSVDGEAT